MSENKFDIIANVDYWKQLVPDFSITESVFKSDVAFFSSDDATLKGAATNLNEEGYFVLNSVISLEETTRFADGIRGIS